MASSVLTMSCFKARIRFGISTNCSESTRTPNLTWLTSNRVQGTPERPKRRFGAAHDLRTSQQVFSNIDEVVHQRRPGRLGGACTEYEDDGTHWGSTLCPSTQSMCRAMVELLVLMLLVGPVPASSGTDHDNYSYHPSRSATDLHPFKQPSDCRDCLRQGSGAMVRRLSRDRVTRLAQHGRSKSPISIGQLRGSNGQRSMTG